MDDSLSSFRDFIDAGRATITLLRDLHGAMSSNRRDSSTSAQDQQIARQIETAETTLERTRAQLAQSLGYKLCQCAFPPKIMLSKGRHPRHDDEIFQCDACGKQEPSEGDFQRKDEFTSATADARFSVAGY
jgi:hypothetical protein